MSTTTEEPPTDENSTAGAEAVDSNDSLGAVKTIYGHNDDLFTDRCEEEAAVSAWENGEYKIGDEVTVFSLDFRRAHASEFMPDVVEHMIDQAYGQIGEFAEEWRIGDDESKELQSAVNALVDSKLKCPLWWPVGKTSEHKMRFTDDTGGAVSVYDQS